MYSLCSTIYLSILVILCGNDKHHGQKQIGEKGVYFTLQLTVHHGGKPKQKIKAGTWIQGVKQRLWEIMLTGLFIITPSVCFLIQTSTNCQGSVHPQLAELSHISDHTVYIHAHRSME